MCQTLRHVDIICCTKRKENPCNVMYLSTRVLNVSSPRVQYKPAKRKQKGQHEFNILKHSTPSVRGCRKIISI